MMANRLFLVVIVMIIVMFAAASAQAAMLSFKTGNFQRVKNSNGEWAVAFDLTATHTGEENRVVTKIYDVTLRIDANAKDMRNGTVIRMSRNAKFTSVKAFAQLDLWPGDSVTARLTVAYTNFKGDGWTWEGEEKHKNFHLTNIKISNVKAKYASKRP